MLSGRTVLHFHHRRATSETDRYGNSSVRVGAAPHRRRSASLGTLTSVAVRGSSQASERKRRRRWARASLRELRSAARRSRTSGRAQCAPNLPAYPVNVPRSRRQARVVGQALAMTAAGRRSCWIRRRRRGLSTAVTFNSRGNPSSSARDANPAGRPREPALPRRAVPAGLAAQGHGLLVAPEPEKRRIVGAWRHRVAWGDLAQHLSGLRITHVLGDITTVCRAQETVRNRRRVCRRRRNQTTRGGPASRWRTWPPSFGVRQRAKGSFSSGRSARGTRTISRSRSAVPRRRSNGGRNTRTSSASASRQGQRFLQKDPSLLDLWRDARAPPGGTRNVGRCIHERDAGLTGSSPRTETGRRAIRPPRHI